MKYINHIEPVTPSKAQNVVADVYAEARAEMGRLPEPVVMLSPNVELLAAGWATLYETLVGGRTPRVRKEAIAAAVAAGLQCPWCVDAHTTMLHAAGESDTAAVILDGSSPPASGDAGEFVVWARGTAAPGGPPAPFGLDDAAEYVGTAVQFHFLARLVLVLLDETFLPGGARVQKLLRRAGGRAFARKFRQSHTPGLATGRIPVRPLPDDLAWADTSSHVATAFAALADCLDKTSPLPDAASDVVSRAVRAWRGEAQPISSSWTNQYTDELPEFLRPATRLALLTALAPYQVTDVDVSNARGLLRDDRALVTAMAWASWTAARHIGSWISRPTTGAASAH